MPRIATRETTRQLRELIHPLTGAASDYAPLLTALGDAKYMLLGEASHGTHEFYKARAEITKRLIQEKGVTVVAWEADWPDALRINRYIQGRSRDRTAQDGPATSTQVLPAELLERAIGVIYLPETERISHYFFARLAEQFDWIIHFYQSRAVEPLDRASEPVKGELPETYPSAV